jgi:NADP-dependent 3-hydroxy acid dehydrogenase YdfG
MFIQSTIDYFPEINEFQKNGNRIFLAATAGLRNHYPGNTLYTRTKFLFAKFAATVEENTPPMIKAGFFLRGTMWFLILY